MHAVISYTSHLCSDQHEASGGPPHTAATAAAADGTVVVGSLANSYAAFQLRLSGALATEHHVLRWGMPDRVSSGCGRACA